MASPSTETAYLEEGYKKLERARRQNPEMRSLEGIFAYLQEYPSVIRPNTARLWRAQLLAVMPHVLAADDRGFSERQMADIRRQLVEKIDDLRGTPEEPRTASAKRKAIPEPEVRLVLTTLHEMALGLHRPRIAVLGLYLLLMPRIGARPIELMKAWVDAGVLVISSAKLGAGHERYISLATWPELHRVALAAFLQIVQEQAASLSYDGWLSAFAEQLARACKAVGVKRMAPSAFRHTAMSTWAAAGYTPQMIALLAGHLTLKSQAHYIRTAAAWGQSSDLVQPVPAAQHEVALLPASTSPPLDNAPWSFEDMPMPPSDPKAEPSVDLWPEWRTRVLARFDSDLEATKEEVRKRAELKDQETDRSGLKP